MVNFLSRLPKEKKKEEEATEEGRQTYRRTGSQAERERERDTTTTTTTTTMDEKGARLQHHIYKLRIRTK